MSPGPVSPEPGSPEDQDGQVSEVAGLEQAGAGEEITPGDATAGYPTENESQRPQEGTAGPNAAPRHDPPEESNRSSR